MLEEHWFCIKLTCSFDAFPGVAFYAVSLSVFFFLNTEFPYGLVIEECYGATGVQ